MGRLGPFEENSIVVGDCLDVMRQMPSRSVDLVVTSPPYNVGLDYAGNFNDSQSPEKHKQFSRAWLSALFRVCSDPSRAYVVVSEEMLFWMREMAEDIGWAYVQFVTWCKPNLASPGRITKEWNMLTEYAMLLRRGKRTSMLSATGITTHNWIVATTPQTNFNGQKKKIHVAQMALELAEKLIARTPGDLVFDPFIGSGTTAVAADRLGRHWFGCDINPEYVEMALKRIEADRLQRSQLALQI